MKEVYLLVSNVHEREGRIDLLDDLNRVTELGIVDSPSAGTRGASLKRGP